MNAKSNKIFEIKQKYVDTIPIHLENGVIYISKQYEIAVHLCACGCGGKTATPLGKEGWLLTDKNDKITLRPSIGNWSGEKPYHAHYFITENKIQWL